EFLEIFSGAKGLLATRTEDHAVHAAIIAHGVERCAELLVQRRRQRIDRRTVQNDVSNCIGNGNIDRAHRRDSRADAWGDEGGKSYRMAGLSTRMARRSDASPTHSPKRSSSAAASGAGSIRTKGQS